MDVHDVVLTVSQRVTQHSQRPAHGAVALDSRDPRVRRNRGGEEGADGELTFVRNGQAMLVPLAVGGAGLEDHMEHASSSGRRRLALGAAG
jgi:hypothetical protein